VFGKEEDIFPVLGIETQIIQPRAIHYTVWAILVLQMFLELNMRLEKQNTHTLYLREHKTILTTPQK